MNIQSILELGAAVTVNIGIADLKEFASVVFENGRRLEREAQAAVAKEDEKLTPREVAARYHVSLPTLWRWARQGYLKPLKLGKRSFYKVSEIEKIINNQN